MSHKPRHRNLCNAAQQKFLTVLETIVRDCTLVKSLDFRCTGLRLRARTVYHMLTL